VSFSEYEVNVLEEILKPFLPAFLLREGRNVMTIERSNLGDIQLSLEGEIKVSPVAEVRVKDSCPVLFEKIKEEGVL
jgi:hypothetical protein